VQAMIAAGASPGGGSRDGGSRKALAGRAAE
jgi:hypothetical protein